ncbi:MAG TPA: NUDIX hydrolase [Chloroflexi bacterium]|nr:NUDIX hydrolase [Chloroflexota bacterium]HAL28950.1 NUDIX hydrolase [Chloroflexota bacterium]
MMSDNDAAEGDPARAAFYADLPRKRVGAGALITDTEGRVLVMEQTYRPTWEIPGGVVESGETAPAGCRRECIEELGIVVSVGRLLVVEHQTERGYRGDSIMYLYDGGVLSDTSSMHPAEGEIKAIHFVAPTDLELRMTAKLARRVMAAVRARESGSVIELEDGVARP